MQDAAHIQDVLRKHRSLTAKTNVSDDDNDDDDILDAEMVEDMANNPLTGEESGKETYTAFTKKLQDFWAEKNKKNQVETAPIDKVQEIPDTNSDEDINDPHDAVVESNVEVVEEELKKEKKKSGKRKRKAVDNSLRERLESADNLDDLFEEADDIMKKKVAQAIVGHQKVSKSSHEDEVIVDNDDDGDADEGTASLPLRTDLGHQVEKKKKEKMIDPNEFIVPTETKVKKLRIEEDGGDSDDGEKEMNEQDAAIAAAFADDDVMIDFK